MRASLPPADPQPSRDLAAAERTLRNGEHRLREILTSAPVAFITLDAEGLILDWNSKAERMFGWRRVEALGCNFAERVLPEPTRPAYERQLVQLLANDAYNSSVHLEVTALCRGGREFVAEIGISGVRTADSCLIDVFVRDISAQCQADEDRRHAEAQLAHQALHDRLTGLPNRTLLLDRLGRALSLTRRHRSVAALLYADIDQFKLVNDSLGHQAGDELIVQVIARLKDVLRAQDTLMHFDHDSMARLGGDQLAVLCESLSAEKDAVGIAERARSAMTRPFVVRDQRVFVRMSIGIALTTTSTTPGALMRDAETAMYQAKARGGDQCEVFDARTRASLLDRVRRENELRDAIERQELRLLYQPIVSLENAKIIGAEALVRWQHPEHGLLPPAQFISLAEESGLIIPLGEWVLRQTVKQLSQWSSIKAELSGAPLRVFVNVSARQLADDGIASLVDVILRENSLSPSQLTLELTESSLIDDISERAAALGRLEALGLRLALDDFGTGYSSLSYLRRLPFHFLKLDRSFVVGLGTTSTDLQIAAAVIKMARALELIVVAEGVETEAQVACLRRLGCQLAQGYYFSQPMPPEELPGLVLAGSWNGSVAVDRSPT